MCNHIRSIHDETKSWCGETLGSEFHFKGVEHAVLNGLHESKLSACTACTTKIVECLLRRVDGDGM